MTSCQETVDLLMDYVDGRLPAQDQAALDAHFAGCPHCRDFLASYRETPRIVREATRTPIPEEVCRRLEEFLGSRR